MRSGDSRARLAFARHVGEMFLAMYLGMAIGPALFVLVTGLSFDEAVGDHAVGFLLVMASSMTAPMVGWMLYRGHSRRNAGEMAAAMLLPALLLVCLNVGHVISGAGCGMYCLASAIAMIALVVHRRGDYRTVARAAPKFSRRASRGEVTS